MTTIPDSIPDSIRDLPRAGDTSRFLEELLAGLIELPTPPVWSLEALIDRIEARQ